MTESGWYGPIGLGSEFHGFVVEGVAGRGGMGVVYRARQDSPNRIVALKVIAGELASDPAFRARFKRESSIAAEIEHPNVIPVHAVGESGGVLYIAMRFVDGVDLRNLLAQEGSLEPRRAAAIIDQVAQALDAAHSRGLVHRDVKPANVLIATTADREHVYLTDFGLARHMDGSQALTGTGAFLGTIDYIAPEQARGERVDARTDVYSLGCALFQTLTGSVPYPFDNELAKLYAHDSQEPPSVCGRNPGLPIAFEAVLSRAMAKRPDDRYLSAGDLGRAALAAASGGVLSRAERSVATGGAAPIGVGAVGGPVQAAGDAGRLAGTTLRSPEPEPTRPAGRAGMPGPAPEATRPATASGASDTTQPRSTNVTQRSRRLVRRPVLLACATFVVIAVAGVLAIVISSGGSRSRPRVAASSASTHLSLPFPRGSCDVTQNRSLADVAKAKITFDNATAAPAEPSGSTTAVTPRSTRRSLGARVSCSRRTRPTRGWLSTNVAGALGSPSHSQGRRPTRSRRRQGRPTMRGGSGSSTSR